MARVARARSVASALLLLLLTAGAYAGAARNGFVWDDDAYVHRNPTLAAPDGLRRIWLEIGATPQYYPLVHTSYWVEYRLWGLDPAGYHVVNVLLHAIAALLLWRVLAQLAVPGAWAAAAVFAVHPVHVESVAWITERKNTLSGALYMASALAYLRFASARGSGQPIRRGRAARLYALAALLFLGALLSKTVTCSLPAALLLVLWWRGGTEAVRSHLRPLAPLFAVGIALGLLTIWMEKHRVGAVGEPWDLSAVERELVAGRALWFYLGKLLWPTRLSFVYPRWEIDAGVWWQFLYPLAALAGLAALWLARGRISRGPLVAMLFFAGTLGPALGFFDVYPMQFSYVADHFQYLASAGPIALACALAARASGRTARAAVAARVALALLLLGYGALTARQVSAYADLETLWRDTVEKNPRAWLAHFNLGNSLRRRGDLPGAVRHYRLALRAKDDLPQAHNSLGSAYGLQGRLEDAIHHYRRALELAPDYARAHYNLATALGAVGRLDGAIHHYRRAIRLDPDDAEARALLGRLLERVGPDGTRHPGPGS